jgi:predicted nucleic acid-binding protein
MTYSAERWACDTSVAVAALDPNHEAHTVCRRALIEWRPALAGHAAFEAHAVLTRLPLPLRLRPGQASQVLAAAFPEPCWLDIPAIAELWSRLGELGLTGGATYDALIAAAARANGRRLLTRDRRAERTYRAVGVDYQFVE